MINEKETPVVKPDDLKTILEHITDVTGNKTVSVNMIGQSRIEPKSIDYSSADILGAIAKATSNTIEVTLEIGQLLQNPDFLSQPWKDVLANCETTISEIEKVIQSILSGIFQQDMNRPLAEYLQGSRVIPSNQKGIVAQAIDLWQRTLSTRLSMQAEVYASRLYDLLAKEAEGFRVPHLTTPKIFDDILDALKILETQVHDMN